MFPFSTETENGSFHFGAVVTPFRDTGTINEHESCQTWRAGSDVLYNGAGVPSEIVAWKGHDFIKFDSVPLGVLRKAGLAYVIYCPSWSIVLTWNS